MMPRFIPFMSLVAAFSLCLLSGPAAPAEQPDGGRMVDTDPSENLVLPPPFATPSVRNTSKVIGWPKGRTPTAAPDFEGLDEEGIRAKNLTRTPLYRQ
jgi:hypothetical protein